MNKFYAGLLLAAVLLVIVSAIWYLESVKPNRIFLAPGSADVQTMSIQEKEKIYPAAKEIVAPAGFINVDNVKIQDLIGKKVILVDFWTYSCINCQRTLPYLTSWYEKYKDQGLEIIGVHTPEFEFEKKIENVQWAIDKYGIKYPVALDNDYGTWNAYANRYWPRKYLIDIDGYVVYDHIGEGAYDATEKKIQELLRERMVRLNLSGEVAGGMVSPEGGGSGGRRFGQKSGDIFWRQSQYLFGQRPVRRHWCSGF